MGSCISFKIEDVDIVAIDFYTIGHFIFGYITNLILFLIMGLLGFPYLPGLTLTISFNVGLFWEIIENFYLWKRGFKFDDRQDSLANSLTDIVFVNIGAIICVIITTFEPLVIFETSTIILAITITVFEFLSRITKSAYNRKKYNGKNKEKV